MTTAVGTVGEWRATADDPGDIGHLVPDEVWAAIVAQVEAPVTLLGRLELPDRTITARSHGGVIVGGPRLGVIHSAETPLAAGYAYSIAANWFATKATTSATVMIDPAETIRLLPDNVVAYHCGPAGNGFTIGAEQAGRASMSRAEWLTPAGRAQMDNLAEYMRECRDRWGIPLRWATLDEVRRARVDPTFRPGWCAHDDIRAAIGGTQHTDPGRNYPRDVLMQVANAGGDDDMQLSELVTYRTVQFDGAARSLYDSANAILQNVGIVHTTLVGEAAKDAARDAALLEALKAIGTGGVAPEKIVAAARQAAQEELANAADRIAAAVLSAQERDELARLRERLAELEGRSA